MCPSVCLRASLVQPTTMSTGHEKEDELSAIENVQAVDDERSLEYKQMTKRVLWKLDMHILPPLALVSYCNNSPFDQE